jgi:uncharacterized protein (DUF1501 family)
MHFIQPEKHTRRAFLRRAGQLAFTGTALPTVMNLAAIGEAAAFDATDYKALVCVFLFGGNDYANTVINYDATSHAQYATIRGGIAIPRADLAATVLNPTAPLPDGKQYALHPAMGGLANLFNTGAAAVQLNVGPLVVPLTRQQYNSNSASFPRPPKLFSHNDQQSVWMTSAAEGTTTGWGGHAGDLARSSNTNGVLTCVSVAGNTVFLSGDQALSYQVSSNGAVRINCLNGNVYGSAAVRSALADIAMQSRTHALENEYNLVTSRAYGTEGAITSALNAFPATSAPFTNFPANNGLANQLRLVARLIAARNQLGSKRQVFFVSLGGFDLHDNLLGAHRLSPGHGGPGRGRQGHRLHGVRFRSHAHLQRRRFRSWLGLAPLHGGWRRARPGLLWQGATGERDQQPRRQLRSMARGPGPLAAQHLGQPVRGHAGAVVRRERRRAGPGAALHRQLQQRGLPHQPGLHGLSTRGFARATPLACRGALACAP